MARIGYARVSTVDQQTDSQLHALASADITPGMLFQETGSGANRERPVLAEALAACKDGDTFVFFQLSRVGRSTQHLLSIAEDLKSRGVAMQSLKENLDTSSAAGRMFFTVLAAMAQFERECTMERINAGIANAKKNGTRSGKPFGKPLKMTAGKKAMAMDALAKPNASYTKVARDLGVSRSLLYEAIPPKTREVAA